MEIQAGAFARSRAKAKRRAARLLLLLLVGIAFVIIALSFGSLATGLGGSLVLTIALTLYIVSERIHRKADQYFETAEDFDKGAEAEEDVEKILAGSDPDQFCVLHDVPCKFGNVDHIVISREGGVFAIETKSSTGTVDAVDGKVIVNGASPERDYISQARANALWLKDTLGRILGQKPYVMAVLLFPHAHVNVKKPVRDVIVSGQSFMLRVLRMLPRSTYQRESIWSRRAQIREELSSARDGRGAVDTRLSPGRARESQAGAPQGSGAPRRGGGRIVPAA